jgi:uncharacterized protein (TIGR02246 family)
MPDLAAELTAFMARYEQANSRHDLERVTAMIAPDATYWFTDGSYHGRPAIEEAIARTFTAIRDETYEIHDLEWIVLTARHAACRYRFSWAGVVDGQPRSGQGRGTNVIVKRDGTWRMQHEHLSS